MSFPSNTVLVLVGPTASGKTAVSLSLASMLDGEIISADSRQVYRYLDIGTAKPTEAERARIPHHFVDILDPDQESSAGEYGIRGRAVIQEIFRRRKVPLIVGGSGLYIQSLTDGFFEGPSADREYRAKLEATLVREGTGILLKMLKEVDPDLASRIDVTKPRRIIRALEVHHLTGVPLSSLRKEKKVDIPFASLRFGLLWQRACLNRRIEQRCEAMLEDGLLQEVDRLVELGYTSELNALNTVGYAEAFAHRCGELTYDEMVREFKKNSRRYAKRQMTWFRRDERISWIEMDDGRVADDVAAEIAGRCGDVVISLAVP